MVDEVLRVLSDDIDAIDSDGPQLTDGEFVRLYEALVTARALDDCSSRLHADGKIGFYVASAGLEAVAVGAGYALEPGDWAFPSHRDPGMYLLRGGSLRSWLDQLFGNAADLTKGRQMPGHHSLPDGRFVSVSSPIGTQIVQAAGCAMAMKARGDGCSALASFGAAAVGGNDFQAGMNLAANFGAPVIFVCRTPSGDGSLVSTSVASVADAYGVRGVRVDGGDVLAVMKAVSDARETAVRGGGPTLVEALINGTTMPGDEIAPAVDPVVRYRGYLEARGAWDAAREEQLRARTQERLDVAVSAAAAAARPLPHSLFADVYSELPWMLLEQREMLPDEGEHD